MAIQTPDIRNNQRELNIDKLVEIERERDDLHDKWVVIYPGKLLGFFESKTDTFDFALEHIPKGNRGSVSKVGAKKRTITYKKSW